MKKGLHRWAHRILRHLQIAGQIARHPRTPWYVRVLAVVLVAYAVSPVDLIPDFIPVLGYLDDLVLLPLGIALIIRLTPRDIRIEAARNAVRSPGFERHPGRWVAAAGIVAIWIFLLALVVRAIVSATSR